MWKWQSVNDCIRYSIHSTLCYRLQKPVVTRIVMNRLSILINRYTGPHTACNMVLVRCYHIFWAGHLNWHRTLKQRPHWTCILFRVMSHGSVEKAHHSSANISDYVIPSYAINTVLTRKIKSLSLAVGQHEIIECCLHWPHEIRDAAIRYGDQAG